MGPWAAKIRKSPFPFTKITILLHNIGMDLTPQLEAALASPQPRARLQQLMADLLEKGAERDDLLPALETYRASLAAEGRGEAEDLIAEIIDGFTSWCNIG